MKSVRRRIENFKIHNVSKRKSAHKEWEQHVSFLNGAILWRIGGIYLGSNFDVLIFFIQSKIMWDFFCNFYKIDISFKNYGGFFFQN